MYTIERHFNGFNKYEIKRIANHIKTLRPRAKVVFNYSPSRNVGFVGAIYAGTPGSYDDGICLYDFAEFCVAVSRLAN